MAWWALLPARHWDSREAALQGYHFALLQAALDAGGGPVFESQLHRLLDEAFLGSGEQEGAAALFGSRFWTLGGHRYGVSDGRDVLRAGGEKNLRDASARTGSARGTSFRR